MQRLRMKMCLIPEVTKRQMSLRNGWRLFTNFKKDFFPGWGFALCLFCRRHCHEDKWIWMCSLLQQLYDVAFFLAGISEGSLSRACVSSHPRQGTWRISAIKTSSALTSSPIWPKENSTVMLAGISFSNRQSFSQFSFLDFKISHVTGLCKYDGKQEGKNAAQSQ